MEAEEDEGVAAGIVADGMLVLKIERRPIPSAAARRKEEEVKMVVVVARSKDGRRGEMDEAESESWCTGRRREVAASLYALLLPRIDGDEERG